MKYVANIPPNICPTTLNCSFSLSKHRLADGLASHVHIVYNIISLAPKCQNGCEDLHMKAYGVLMLAIRIRELHASVVANFRCHKTPWDDWPIVLHNQSELEATISIALDNHKILDY